MGLTPGGQASAISGHGHGATCWELLESITTALNQDHCFFFMLLDFVKVSRLNCLSETESCEFLAEGLVSRRSKNRCAEITVCHVKPKQKSPAQNKPFQGEEICTWRTASLADEMLWRESMLLFVCLFVFYIALFYIVS